MLWARYSLFPLTQRGGGGTDDAAEEGTGGAALEDGGDDKAEGCEAPYAFSDS
jgi:hypothetical protein